MQPVLTAIEMQQADSAAIEKLHISPICLMELAGKECIGYMLEKLSLESPEGLQFLIVAGKGNNGGDGFVIARHLLNLGAAVDLVLLYPEGAAGGAAEANMSILRAYEEEGLPLRIFNSIEEAIPFVSEQEYSVTIDAMTGTGLRLEAPGAPLLSPLAEGVELLNALHERSEALCMAVDIPTGLDATSGHAAMPAVTADFTITMGFMKTGLLLQDGPELCGEVHVAEISIPGFLAEDAGAFLIDESFAAEHFALRSEGSAKHMNGKVLIIAGSSTGESSMGGAALLAAGAAVKTGAGYVAVSIPPSLAATLHIAVPEAIVIGRDMDSLMEKARWSEAILIGPGLGRSPESIDLVRALLSHPDIFEKKLILDADALYAIAEAGLQNVLSAMPEVLITPHYGELARLTGTDAGSVTKDPLAAATRFADTYSTTVLLKGRPTIIAKESGPVLLNTSGTEALATAGTGDVLSGMVAALAAKGECLPEAAAAAAWFHGRAGDLASDVSSLVSASMVRDAIPSAIEEMFDFED
ncbi:bifunctional ADP-dependent NAD(P)H-hydrate dehydratase/NAD(P)H-hydrate epimerase [Pelodictyon luteolum]|uniref:Bifunctional NAD(P)H-hydrate repair enzyme n=1 Tax=Chlorobium luteolum (strain DSM 273 / BCRC 81028 / 2530) TaxID=319225 RepID=Q3B3X9_CHLL3|nr:bifunctional ADP-dependent NAD(P)H-hydrate dehydratase/NAD(P)H-hydrate epimerase [Pelodictyon luteolum]ABB23952.1 YjeF-related protein-like protein [Pelodictyon luteolum DSM 273]